MALVLGLAKGDIIYVGETPVEVTGITGDTGFVLTCCGVRVQVSDTKAVEILPQVRVSAGIGSASLARVVLSAPKSIKIYREGLRKEHSSEG